MNFDRVQRYLQTLKRVPTDDEAADIVRMSRRSFFGFAAALAAAPYFAPHGQSFHSGGFLKWNVERYLVGNYHAEAIGSLHGKVERVPISALEFS